LSRPQLRLHEFRKCVARPRPQRLYTYVTNVSAADGYGDFEAFYRSSEAKLRRALTAAFGPEVGREAAAEALAYAYEHWARLAGMSNPAGYAYRVGQSRGRRMRRKVGRRSSWISETMTTDKPQDGELADALRGLSRQQRTAVVLIAAYSMTSQDAGDLMGLRASTVQTHASRGLAKLRAAMMDERIGQ
jgi:DNA-directed RNA polymerase specialized sigma24 family protein